MSAAPRTTRCAISGAEIVQDESFVLDVGAAHRRLRALRAEMDAVDRVLTMLSYRVAPQESAGRREFRLRLVVSLGVAAALDTGATRGLFVPWQEHQQRQHDRFTQQLLAHPTHGARLRAMEPAHRTAVLDQGRRLAGRVSQRVGSLDPQVWMAIACSAASALYELPAAEAFRLLGLAEEDQLRAWGVPEPTRAPMLAVLRRCRSTDEGTT